MLKNLKSWLLFHGPHHAVAAALAWPRDWLRGRQMEFIAAGSERLAGSPIAEELERMRFTESSAVAPQVIRHPLGRRLDSEGLRRSDGPSLAPATE